LEQVVLDQNVWGATRDSIHAQLSDSHRRAEEAVKAREIAEAKLRDATQDRESLLERILTLEQQLGYLQKCIEDPSAIDALNEDISTSAGSPRASDTASNKSQVNKAVQIVSLAKYTDLQARYDNIASQLRDTRRRLTEAQGDLEVLRYQAQIDESKIREISRQSVSAASLYKAELAESQMLCELYR
jgi:acetolactate synthase regulatory subunit